MEVSPRKRKSSPAFKCFVVGLFVGYWLAVWGEATILEAGTLLGATVGGILGVLIGLTSTET